MGSDNLDLKNCKKCGRVHYGYGDVCSYCFSRDEEMFQKIKAYLNEYPNSSAHVVSEETGVSMMQIEKYLKEGRLEITDGMEGFLRCERCGKSIRTGRYCVDCEKNLVHDLKTAYAPKKVEKEEIHSKMHHKFDSKRQ